MGSANPTQASAIQLCVRTATAPPPRVEHELTPYRLPSRFLSCWLRIFHMRLAALISVASDLISRTRTGGLLLISGFREADVPAVRAALEPHFSMPDAPAVEREGRADEAGGKWIGYICRRTDVAYDVREMSESALQ